MDQMTVINVIDCKNPIINCGTINKDTPTVAQEKFPILRKIISAIGTLLAIQFVNYIMENFGKIAGMLGMG